MFAFFDSETTGFLAGKDPSHPKQPHLVQLGMVLTDALGNVKQAVNVMVKPDGYEIPANAANVHGITTEDALSHGIPRSLAVSAFCQIASVADYLVCHNVDFDMTVIKAAIHREGAILADTPTFCTMSDKSVVNFCAIPPTAKMKAVGRHHFKNPNLTELHEKCFGKGFGNAHNAMADVKATMNCFFHMKKNGVISL